MNRPYARLIDLIGRHEHPLPNAPAMTRRTLHVEMRDGTRLATELFMPEAVPRAPTVAIRTPYDRASEAICNLASAFCAAGYVFISQDCRGTGESEPSIWDYYVYESEDSYDFVAWITAQSWFDGFIGSLGGSYIGQTQWCMSAHPAMRAIIPQVSGLGIARTTVQLHMFLNAYAKTVGNNSEPISYSDMEAAMAEETLANGFYDAPLAAPFPAALQTYLPANAASMDRLEICRHLWKTYCGLSAAERADFVRRANGSSRVGITDIEGVTGLLDCLVPHDAFTLPATDERKLCASLHAVPLMMTGWYDWGLNDALATWQALRRSADRSLRDSARLVITPSAHIIPGYHEGSEEDEGLRHGYNILTNPTLALEWFATVQSGAYRAWPRVLYYLMGASEWRATEDWPPPEAREASLYLTEGRGLGWHPPASSDTSDQYIYDPLDPTPTVGGSIVSSVYVPGSVDVSKVQERHDIVVYTSDALESDVAVVGPLRMILFVQSSAGDTDFSVRLSDVFPDGRAIQLQSGMLRTRHRDPNAPASLLQPDTVQEIEVDMWATANLFKRGHRIRVDISSADFPKYNRNANLGGESGPPRTSVQTIFCNRSRPSRLVLKIID